MARGRGSHESQIVMENKMAVEKIDGEDPDLLMGEPGCIVEADWLRSNAKKDGGIDGGDVADGSSNVVVGRDEKNSDIVVYDAGKRGRERMVVERWNGDKWEDGIRVGDLVWVGGKSNSDPWWPGQVYDPRKASEFVLRYSREGCLLVVFFGDRACCWCLPSELIPFVENLDKMVHSGSSKGFVNAVQEAVAEMSRNVESKNTCRCIPVEKRGRLSRPVAHNYGVKEAGALIPEVEFDRLHIQEDEPSGILAKVHGYARSASFDSVLDLHVLKSWMSAYAYARHGGGLCVYSDPTVIEGLEDKSSVVNAPFHGPDGDDHSSANVKTAKSEAEINERRKKKMKYVAGLYLVEKKEGEVERGLSSRKRA